MIPEIIDNLLVFSELCDSGCEVHFLNRGKVNYNRENVLRGWRDIRNRLWRVSLKDNGVKNRFHLLHKIFSQKQNKFSESR